MKEPLLDTLERKCRKFTIKNLMSIIIIGTAIVWLLDFIVGFRAGVYVSWYLQFDAERIFSGEVWRIITFVFVPMEHQMFYFLISMYFYWFIGTGLEREWGSFRFDLFYFFGVICNIIYGLIVGFATVEYLHLSMFIAYAFVNPNDIVLLFFIIPVKMKWLAIIDIIVLGLIFFAVPWQAKIAIAIALLNVVVFFSVAIFKAIGAGSRRKKWKKQWDIEKGGKDDNSTRNSTDSSTNNSTDNNEDDSPFEL